MRALELREPLEPGSYEKSRERIAGGADCDCERAGESQRRVACVSQPRRHSNRRSARCRITLSSRPRFFVSLLLHRSPKPFVAFSRIIRWYETKRELFGSGHRNVTRTVQSSGAAAVAQTGLVYATVGTASSLEIYRKCLRRIVVYPLAQIG